MKEYFQKIVAWAKAHPWLAAGILGGIVIVIWLAIRNGWFGGGGNGEAAAVVPPGGDGTSAAPGLGNLPDTSALPPGVSEIGQSASPIPVELPSMANYLPSFPSYGEAAQPAPASYDMGYPAGAMLASPSGAALASSGMSTTGLGAPRQVSYQSLVSALTAPEALANPALAFRGDPGYAPRGNSAPIKTSVLVSSVKAAVTNVSKAASKKETSSKKSSSGQTPAQKLGKGKNFTGYINGVYYKNGYIAQSTPSAPASQSGANMGAYTGQASSTQTSKGGSLTSYFGGSV